MLLTITNQKFGWNWPPLFILLIILLYTFFLFSFFLRHDSPDQEPDACRIHGSLVLNKIAGNLHITAGKSFQLPDGHIHLPAFILPSSYNFSHRIHHFSFGDSSAGIINPLDGDEKITDER